ncbi:MAG TPA: LLM class flavin-dependent oxidoreductase, partial [Dehalococcoidia bacterium]|nr:LLM class flavin-dependent oxidoreductase [Dehalococcoidia bacterium]
LQRPYPPLWYPTSSADRIPWVASHGFNTLFGFTRTSLDVIADGIAQYRVEFAAHEGDAGRLNGHVAEPRLGATRHVYVAATDDEAMRVARTAYTEFERSYVTRPGHAPTGDASRRGDFDTAIGWGGIFAGSPDSVRLMVQDFVDRTGANYFVGTFAFGNLTTEQILSSMRLFAEAVMPAITPAALSDGAKSQTLS